jgi:murein DD-endopeptidase MepM/ murein hydrolase activator NlpD
MTNLDRINLMRIAAQKVPYAMPVKATHRFTSGYGTRRDPKNGRLRLHSGIDLAGPRGTPIHTTADGIVTYAGRMSGYGLTIKVRHSFGFETLYAHLSKIRVKKGQRVSRGKQIGDMGNTGRSTGTHLHYEVRVGGKAVNPMSYIKAAKNVLKE